MNGRRRAFLIIELLIASALFMLSITTLTALYYTSSCIHTDGTKRLQALMIAQQIVEGNQVAYEPRVFTVTSIERLTNNMPLIRVEVSWRSARNTACSLVVHRVRT